MIFLISILASIIPMTFYLIMIWRLDYNERERFSDVLKHFGWGAFGAIIFALFGSLLLKDILSVIISDVKSLDHLSTVLIAPFIEEITKGFLLLRTVNSKKFDNVTDGLVYGTAIGLGFGMTENIMYYLGYGPTIQLILMRTLFSAVMHGLTTGIFGAFLANAKFSKNSFITGFFPFVGLFSAMLIHFLWNFSVSFGETYLVGMLFLILLIFLYGILFRASLKKENKIIRKQLKLEANERRIPLEHLEILCSDRRYGKGWIAEDIRKSYIESVIKLAFRKEQFESTSGKKKIFYKDEILMFQNKIDNLLKENIEENNE